MKKSALALAVLAMLPIVCAVPIIEWNTTVGNPGDWLSDIQTTSDGGYVAGGSYAAYDWHGDFWVSKLNSNGTPQWDYVQGWVSWENLDSAQPASDGGYIACGYTSAFNGHNSGYILKLNASGAEQWNKSWVSANDTSWDHVAQTSDGGYIFAGGISTPNDPVIDMMLMKTDSNGTTEWTRTYGANADNMDPSGVLQASDGGYAVVGVANAPEPGEYRVWLVKTDSNGSVEWNMTYGPPGISQPSSLVQTSDGGYAFSGNN
ncbi:Uncharacterised protein [uncultured archaeon]|nr:Uncharacterised protein [uncultured archaeon]